MFFQHSSQGSAVGCNSYNEAQWQQQWAQLEERLRAASREDVLHLFWSYPRRRYCGDTSLHRYVPFLVASSYILVVRTCLRTEDRNARTWNFDVFAHNFHNTWSPRVSHNDQHCPQSLRAFRRAWISGIAVERIKDFFHWLVWWVWWVWLFRIRIWIRIWIRIRIGILILIGIRIGIWISLGIRILIDFVVIFSVLGSLLGDILVL